MYGHQDTFNSQRNVREPSSTQLVEARCSSKTSVTKED